MCTFAFYLDCIACLPIELIDRRLFLLRLGKLLKLRLISKWINKLNLATKAKSLMKLLVIIFNMCLFLLVLASVWSSVVSK